jgi:hypothetical protein
MRSTSAGRGVSLGFTSGFTSDGKRRIRPEVTQKTKIEVKDMA